MLRRALEGTSVHIKERFEAPGRQAFAFRITGRHVGPLHTPLGEIDPTGCEVTRDGMDIFVVDDEAEGVTGVWAIADLFDLLMQTGAVERAKRSAT
jgi:hypothetical protein